MVGVETPSSLAVRFRDKPLTESGTAAAFRASGLPRAGVWVKFRPHPLHKERCCPRISPFFTCASLPQRLHRSPMTTLLHDLSVSKIGHLCSPKTLPRRRPADANGVVPGRARQNAPGSGMALAPHPAP